MDSRPDQEWQISQPTINTIKCNRDRIAPHQEQIQPLLYHPPTRKCPAHALSNPVPRPSQRQLNSLISLQHYSKVESLGAPPWGLM